MNSKIKNSLFLVFFIPILVNTVINISKTIFSGQFNFINIFNAVSVLLLFLLLLNIGVAVKKCLNLNSNSFGITVFIFSFFIVDIVILYLYNKASFNEIFILEQEDWK